MSFSNTAKEQREKEAKSVKSFLTVSVIGSLAVHIGVLASGLGNLLSVAPQIEEDNPIEITFVEPQTQETPKPPQEKIQEKQPTPAPVPQAQTPRKKVDRQKVTSPQEPVQPEQRTAKVQQQPVEQSKPTATNKPVENSSSAASQASSPTANNNASERPTTSSRETGDSVSGDAGVLIGRETNAGIAFGNNNNVTSATAGNNTSTGRRKRETVATGSSAPNVPTEIRRSRRDSDGSNDGRASCQECNTAYPEQARRNRIEGRVEVAVDTDAQGNVTNVRVVRSSGNRELDEATVRQARDWKLKPSQSGRQGVTIGTEYAIEGSQRHRQLQERTRQQTTAVQPGRNRRQMETTTNSASNSTTRQRQRVATSSKKPTTSNTPTSNRRSRRSNVATNSNNRSTSSTPRRVRRNRVATSSTRKPAATQTRRQRRQPVVSRSNARQSTPRRRREFNRANNNSRRQRQLATPKDFQN
jgi:TonB family protein